MATVFGLMSPHPGEKIPLIVPPSLVHVALYAICFRFCEDVTVNSPTACVEQLSHLNFFEESIPDYCDEAPTPVSAKCPRDIAILSFEGLTIHP